MPNGTPARPASWVVMKVLVNDVQVVLHKSSEMAGRHHVCFMGLDFSAALVADLPGHIQADGQAEHLHPEFGRVGFGDELFECGGAGLPQEVKFLQVAHGWDPQLGLFALIAFVCRSSGLRPAHDGKVKITDFGIARIASQTVTRTGFTMGTPAYMSPEQVVSAKVAGPADQFSLGV
ncbi:MAG: hypothetical protein LAQ69_47500 [Acidobacteriia bacterium]|nr:hypothetical protein [Terriglobia bacterium]